MSAGSPAVSVVVPLFNEEENVPILQAELTTALGGLDYEIVFVDDGSVDQTMRRIVPDPRIRVVQFERNAGQSAAMYAGLQRARGAVAVLIVFTILLTRRDVEKERGFNWSGVVIAVVVFGGLASAILKTPSLGIAAPGIEALTVKRIGEALMTDYVWPLQCIGLLLTAALIGALILVMEEKRQ